MDKLTGEAMYALGQAIAGGPGPTSVSLPSGEQLKVSKHPRSGVDLEITRVGKNVEPPLVTMYTASASRPTDYPVDAPFMPGTPVGVTSLGEGCLFLNWPTVADPTTFVRQLRDDRMRRGWEELRDDVNGNELSATVITLTRAQLETRLIVAGHAGGAIVQLIQSTCG